MTRLCARMNQSMRGLSVAHGGARESELFEPWQYTDADKKAYDDLVDVQ